MSNCIAKLPHSCGSSDGLQVFGREDGGVDGFCFSCRTPVRHPYGEERSSEDLPKKKVKTEEEIQLEMSEISSYPVVDVKQKRLRGTSLDYFGVKVGLSQEDGKTPDMLCYPYRKDGELAAYKMKLLSNKRIWSLGKMKDVEPFGWQEALKSGARRLVITEGEDDAISFHSINQLFAKEGYKDYTAFISIPHGVHNAKEYLGSWSKTIKSSFSEVVLCFDMDKPGRDAVKEVSLVFPGISSIDIPGKDANQCVIDGKSKALYNCLFKSTLPKNTRIVRANDIKELAKVPPKYGELTWPWPHINKATRGIRLGETVYVGAGVKMGKSDIVNSLTAHFITKHNIKVMMAKLEEVNAHSYKLVAGKVVGKVFHDPDIAFDEEAFDKASEKLDDKLLMIDGYQLAGWETLKEDIIYCASEGVKAVMIDPITNLTVGMASGDANTKLQEIAVELSSLAKDLNIVIFIFCHLKAHEGNLAKDRREKYYRENKTIGLGSCPHEYGGDIFSSQFAGSRAMMRSCHMMIGLEGNKDPELPKEIRNVRNLKILEERTYGISGVFPIYYNENTTIYEEC